MKPRVLPNLSDKAYYSQLRLKTPHLTYSSAKDLITKSPYHCYRNHPKLGGEQGASTSAMSNGQLIHNILLEGGKDIVELPYDSYRTKAAKEAQAVCQLKGQIPMLAKDKAVIDDAVAAITEQIQVYAPYFFSPERQTELAIRYELEGVKCQSKLDNYVPGHVIDLKTTKDANPESIEKDIVRFGYDIQLHMYQNAADLAFPDLAGRQPFEFIFCEIEPPYMVTVCEPDGELKQYGKDRTMRAIRMWKKLLAMEEEPMRGYGRRRGGVPGWAVFKEEGAA